MNARLDARDRILCAVLDCAAPLGFVLEALDHDGTPQRVAVLPSGWRPQDGVWKPTAHSARHRAVYGTYKTRAAPKWADTPSQKRSRKLVRIYPMPARIQCPAPGCGMVQVLDPAALRVSTTWRPVRVAGASGRRSDPPLVMVPREVAEAKGF